MTRPTEDQVREWLRLYGEGDEIVAALCHALLEAWGGGIGSHAADLREMRAQAARADAAERRLSWAVEALEAMTQDECSCECTCGCSDGSIPNKVLTALDRIRRYALLEAWERMDRVRAAAVDVVVCEFCGAMWGADEPCGDDCPLYGLLAAHPTPESED